jgi:hypothetical protein
MSRTECNIDVTPGTLTATDTCIGYRLTRFEASRNVILHTRYVSTCVGAVRGRGRGTKISITDTHNNSTCDMYKSSPRHIHDPVLSSLKMKGIRLIFLRSISKCFCSIHFSFPSLLGFYYYEPKFVFFLISPLFVLQRLCISHSSISSPQCSVKSELPNYVTSSSLVTISPFTRKTRPITLFSDNSNLYCT